MGGLVLGLGWSWGGLGRSWAVLGGLGVVLGWSWGDLGRFWGEHSFSKTPVFKHV